MQLIQNIINNKEVRTEEEYEAGLERCNDIMRKGEANITKEEGDELLTLATAIQDYEIKNHYQ